MEKVDLEYLCLKNIFGMGLPVYMLGALSKVSKALLQMTKRDGYRFEAVWDEKWQQCKPNGLYKVKPVPVNMDAVAEGIVIVAEQARYQRKWLSYAEKSIHRVYDGYDVRLYTTYCKCIETKYENSLLEKCRNCRASYRSCPVRREWYKAQQGEMRTKVISHLAMKVGYICNLKCNYCCEYITRFTSKHKKSFDLQGCLSDIEKLADSLEYINILSFSGGDAMLNRGLSVLIDKAAEKTNIGDIYILTNGTYLPHKDILDALEKHRDRIRIEINNYSINHEAEKIIPELKRRGISCNLRDNAGWYDLTDTSFRNYSIYRLKDLYENCSFDRQPNFYHIMVEGKINMRCGVANSLLYYLDKFKDCTEDYIDIRNLSMEEIPDALTSLEDRGYLDICNYCVGCKSADRVIEAAAEQLGISNEEY